MIAPEPSVAPAVSTAEAERIAREVFDIAATARRLPGEYDDNFHLRTTSGAEFVLKIMHPARVRELLDLQCSVLSHLAARAPQLTLPQVRLTRNSKLFDSIGAEDGSQRLVWMLSFIPGKVLAEVKPHSPELLRELGRVLGEMDAALASFAHPAATRELKWDSTRALWIREIANAHWFFPNTMRTSSFSTLDDVLGEDPARA